MPDPATRLEPACARLREEPGLADLPERFSLFGLTRLPAGHLQVLRALARRAGRPPLPPAPVARAVGGDRASRRRRSRAAPRTRRRRCPRTACSPPGARTRASCSSCSGRTSRPTSTPSSTARARCSPASRPTCAPTARPPGRRCPATRTSGRSWRPTDRSVQVHACHGRARQVEVLRDAILHLLEEDPTLEPRDVIVMCPDIETFAPLIQATFGAGEVSAADEDELEALPAAIRPPDLRVRLADRSLRQTNPVLGVVARLLELAEQRLTASQVIDLVDREPVRRRFGLDDDGVARLAEWIAESGIRWGLDAEHRDAVQARRRRGRDVAQRPGPPAGRRDDERATSCSRACCRSTTWRAGRSTSRGASPSCSTGWAPRSPRSARRRPSRRGRSAIAGAADSLAAAAPREAWQRAELQRLLDDVVREAAGHPGVLELAEIRALLAERLQGRPTRANFRTGHLTICTLVPMRSVPHRVVCLLGLDDGAFPRKAPRDGDDLMLLDPHVGERDSRTEDRQMLLDALLAATDRLIITFTGNDERTNIARPPAVPVGELLDVVDRTAHTPEGPARGRVLVKHPLQPFDPRNFARGALVPDKPWSFDHVTLDGARALAAERTRPRAVPRRAAARQPRARPRTRGSRPLHVEPRRRVPAPAAGHRRRRLLDGDRGRAAGRTRRPGPLAGRPAGAGSPARRDAAWTPPSKPRSRAAGSRPAGSPTRRSSASARSSRRSSRRPGRPRRSPSTCACCSATAAR